jgi:hypothetical protein
VGPDRVDAAALPAGVSAEPLDVLTVAWLASKTGSDDPRELPIDGTGSRAHDLPRSLAWRIRAAKRQRPRPDRSSDQLTGARTAVRPRHSQLHPLRRRGGNLHRAAVPIAARLALACADERRGDQGGNDGRHECCASKHACGPKAESTHRAFLDTRPTKLEAARAALQRVVGWQGRFLRASRSRDRRAKPLPRAVPCDELRSRRAVAALLAAPAAAHEPGTDGGPAQRGCRPVDSARTYVGATRVACSIARPASTARPSSSTRASEGPRRVRTTLDNTYSVP